MMKLIEKIIDKILGDEIYLFSILAAMVIICFFSCMTIEGMYNKKLRTDVALAKIAAGQNVDLENY